MKVAKKILLWTFIALVIQLPIYYLADRYIRLKENIRIYKKDLGIVNEKMIRDINVPITGDWKFIKTSSNCKYISYMENNLLNIQNMDTNERIELKFKDGEELAYYNWIPDRERLIIIEKIVKDKESIFTISYYEDRKSVV